MTDLLLQFKAILENTTLSILDIACLIYIFRQIMCLVIYLYKKIKGVK